MHDNQPKPQNWIEDKQVTDLDATQQLMAISAIGARKDYIEAKNSSEKKTVVVTLGASFPSGLIFYPPAVTGAGDLPFRIPNEAINQITSGIGSAACNWGLNFKFSVKVMLDYLENSRESTEHKTFRKALGDKKSVGRQIYEFAFDKTFATTSAIPYAALSLGKMFGSDTLGYVFTGLSFPIFYLMHEFASQKVMRPIFESGLSSIAEKFNKNYALTKYNKEITHKFMELYIERCRQAIKFLKKNPNNGGEVLNYAKDLYQEYNQNYVKTLDADMREAVLNVLVLLPELASRNDEGQAFSDNKKTKAIKKSILEFLQKAQDIHFKQERSELAELPKRDYKHWYNRQRLPLWLTLQVTFASGSSTCVYGYYLAVTHLVKNFFSEGIFNADHISEPVAKDYFITIPFYAAFWTLVIYTSAEYATAIADMSSKKFKELAYLDKDWKPTKYTSVLFLGNLLFAFLGYYSSPTSLELSKSTYEETGIFGAAFIETVIIAFTILFNFSGLSKGLSQLLNLWKESNKPNNDGSLQESLTTTIDTIEAKLADTSAENKAEILRKIEKYRADNNLQTLDGLWGDGDFSEELLVDVNNAAKKQQSQARVNGEEMRLVNHAHEPVGSRSNWGSFFKGVTDGVKSAAASTNFKMPKVFESMTDIITGNCCGRRG